MVSIDLTKAFDTINRSGLSTILQTLFNLRRFQARKKTMTMRIRALIYVYDSLEEIQLLTYIFALAQKDLA